MDHLESLEEIRRQLCRERSAVRNELRNYPEGALMLVQEHGKVQKYMVGGAVPDRKRVGIGREPEMVRKLARKAFINAKSEILSRDIELLEGTIADFQQYEASEVLAALPKHFGELPEEFLLSPAIKQRGSLYGPHPDPEAPIRPARLWLDYMSPDEWGALPYHPNMAYPEHKRITMPGGLKVRSKSEANILSLFTSLKLNFHYDEVLDFSDLLDYDSVYAFRTTIRSPDTILARSDGKLFFHEHVGMAGSTPYLQDFQDKLKLYHACGIVPWDNLIITYDDPRSGINISLIEALLKDRGLV